VNAVALAIVAAGIALTAAVGTRAGFGVATLILFVLIVACGVLVVAIARKSKSGSVAPATCTRCGGLNSPNAPFCKHCGAPAAPPR
jgi:ribosomal protein L40E